MKKGVHFSSHENPQEPDEDDPAYSSSDDEESDDTSSDGRQTSARFIHSASVQISPSYQVRIRKKHAFDTKIVCSIRR